MSYQIVTNMFGKEKCGAEVSFEEMLSLCVRKNLDPAFIHPHLPFAFKYYYHGVVIFLATEKYQYTAVVKDLC